MGRWPSGFRCFNAQGFPLGSDEAGRWPSRHGRHYNEVGDNEVVSQSLANLHIHVVFSTKQRAPLITDEVRPALQAYMATILQDIDCPAAIINSIADHVHILCELARTIAVSKVVETVKAASSRWIKMQGNTYAGFAWQSGYGAFSVSESQVETVRHYIANQAEHHRKFTFQDEYRHFLQRHRIAFDEHHVWD